MQPLRIGQFTCKIPQWQRWALFFKWENNWLHMLKMHSSKSCFSVFLSGQVLNDMFHDFSTFWTVFNIRHLWHSAAFNSPYSYIQYCSSNNAFLSLFIKTLVYCTLTFRRTSVFLLLLINRRANRNWNVYLWTYCHFCMKILDLVKASQQRDKLVETHSISQLSRGSHW